MIVQFSWITEKKLIHQGRNLLEVRRNVIPDVNRLFPEPPAKLRDIGDGDVVQGPKGVFVKRFNPF